MVTKAMHDDTGKSGVDQIPPYILLELGEVYSFGSKKYGRGNWLLGIEWSRFYGSVLRHLLAFWMGEDYDEESHLSHLAHAMWGIAALRHFQVYDLGEDDRWQPK